MMYYACAFSQSEMEKYFEWIISLVLQWSRTMVYENAYHENDVIIFLFKKFSLALMLC